MKFRKRIKIAPGMTMNVSHKSIGTTVGGKHVRVSANSRRGVTVGASAPGTGLYTSQNIGGQSKQNQPKNSQKRRRRKYTFGDWMLSILAILTLFMGILANPVFLLAFLFIVAWMIRRGRRRT